MIPLLAVAYMVTDKARELAADVREAWRRCGGTITGFAQYTGLSDKQAYQQLTAQSPLNLWRLAQLPSEFLERFAEVLAERHGKLVLPKDRITMILTVENGVRPMLRMNLPNASTDKKDVA